MCRSGDLTDTMNERRVRFRDTDETVKEGEWTADGIDVDGGHRDVSEVEVLPPTEPSKLVCAASNYREGFDDSSEFPDEPILFLKTPNAVASHGDAIELPGTENVIYEGELAVVIGERCRNVSRADALDVVEGYTCANDISNREVENMVRRKAFDDAAPIGPVLAPPEDVPADAELETRINGEVKQRSSLSQLVFDVRDLIASITSDLTLEPGDVVLTGSPPGQEPLSDGDVVEIEIEGVGTLTHTVTT